MLFKWLRNSTNDYFLVLMENKLIISREENPRAYYRK